MSQIPSHQTQAQKLYSSDGYRDAEAALLRLLVQQSSEIQGVRSAVHPQLDEANRQRMQEFMKHRGRDLYYPYLSSGIGNGPLIELNDGSVKYDMITGIGINFFGHSHPELMKEVIRAAPSDVMQGNLQPGVEATAVLQEILKRVGPKSRLKHAWLMCSGTMVNEVALKIVRQKKSPATKILAFEDCFAGRSTAMQEITDNPGYRQGQPVYGEVHYLPFYQQKLGLERSIQITVDHLDWIASRYPGMFAAMMIELVQGEGGFRYAPREWYVAVFDAAKRHGIAIWIDEVQSFGRTGELFAYQTFGLDEYVDVVTVGKMLQSCLALYTEEFNPKPGLVAGTFSGSSATLRSAARVLQLLDEEGHLGPNGKTQLLSKRFQDHLKHLQESLKDPNGKSLIEEIRAVGGMIAFQPMDGSMDTIKKVLLKLYDLGVVAFYCGHGPYFIRMLPPLGAMSDAHVDEVCQLIGKALRSVSEQGSQAANKGGASG